MQTKLLIRGNSKLSSKILTFSIPASKAVCGRECEGCYAKKAQVRFPVVDKYRSRVLEITKTQSFVAVMNAVLKRIKLTEKFKSQIGGKEYVSIIRIHQSGEFYSQEYIDKWVDIIKANSNFMFYTYTKRLEEFDFTEMKALPNMVLKDSYFKGQVNYATKEGLDIMTQGTSEDDFFVCPDDGTDRICGDTCTHCMEKEFEDKNILFVKH